MLAGLVVVGLCFTNVSVSFGAYISSVKYAENDQELTQAENNLNTFVQGMHDSKIKTYKELGNSEPVDIVVKNLKARGYPVNEDYVVFIKEIEQYKVLHPGADAKKIVKYFNQHAGLKQKKEGRVVSIMLIPHALAISYNDWTNLSPSEKILVALYPGNALLTSSLATLAFTYTAQKFGDNGLGNMSDGYRHGIWSALMTRDISRAWAFTYGTAHEDVPATVLNSTQADGYFGYQHQNMDLTNNGVGRGVLAWYEYYFNCSDSVVKSRIAAKLTNTPGNIIWLHQ